jgi:DNA repair protein RadD
LLSFLIELVGAGSVIHSRCKEHRVTARITDTNLVRKTEFKPSILRPYQVELLDSVRAKFAVGAQRVAMVAPTGSGKTVMFSSVVDGAMRHGRRCLILAHRAELIDQTDRSLIDLGVPHGVIAPGYPATPEPVQVASIQSLVRRLDQYNDYDLVILDECHHATARTWRKVIDAMPNARVLGVSATPERADGAGLGDVFEEMVVGPDTALLIGAGFLSPFTAYAPTRAPDLSRVGTRAGDYAVDQLSNLMVQSVVIGSVVDAYERHAIGKRAIAYGVDVKHSEGLAQRFREAGYAAVHLDGTTPKDERRRIIAALGTGEIKVVANCGLISEGTDVPAVEAVLLARPTQSAGLYLQQVGRALRVAPGKERAIVLDLVGNIGRHGLPDAPREWSLKAKARKQREVKPRRPRTCEACSTINKPLAIRCECCGTLLVTPIERREIEAELRRIDQERIRKIRSMSYFESLRWAGDDEEKLEQIALAKNYRPAWVQRALEEARA